MLESLTQWAQVSCQGSALGDVQGLKACCHILAYCLHILPLEHIAHNLAASWQVRCLLGSGSPATWCMAGRPEVDTI